MDFSVDKNGTFYGTSYNVTNKSQSKVAVSVANFTEENTQGGITIFQQVIRIVLMKREEIM